MRDIFVPDSNFGQRLVLRRVMKLDHDDMFTKCRPTRESGAYHHIGTMLFNSCTSLEIFIERELHVLTILNKVLKKLMRRVALSKSVHRITFENTETVIAASTIPTLEILNVDWHIGCVELLLHLQSSFFVRIRRCIQRKCFQM